MASTSTEEMERVIRRVKQLQMRVRGLKTALSDLMFDHAIFIREESEESKASSEEDKGLQRELFVHMVDFDDELSHSLSRLNKVQMHRKAVQLTQALKEGTNILVLRIDHEMMPPGIKPLIRDMKRFLDSILGRDSNNAALEGSDGSDITESEDEDEDESSENASS